MQKWLIGEIDGPRFCIISAPTEEEARQDAADWMNDPTFLSADTVSCIAMRREGAYWVNPEFSNTGA